MKPIKIRVPNKSYDKEWEVLDAVTKLLNRFEKDPNISIYWGQGGNLDDWKEPDFGNQTGLLMLFRVSLKGEEALKKAELLYKKALRNYKRYINAKKLEIPAGYSLLLAKMELDTAISYLKQV